MLDWLWLNLWFPFKFHILLGGYPFCQIDQLKYLNKCYDELGKELGNLRREIAKVGEEK